MSAFVSQSLKSMIVQLATYMHGRLVHECRIEEEGKDQERYNQVPNLAHDTEWKSDKNTRKHHMLEIQEVCPFPR